ncbi:hypothetical protein AV540_19330 [Brevibacillus parabrevis]|mgnify:CR=1 FL=1|nr:hypothetical protein AV540_19330 [Brevibacillus parabrevis]
MIPLKDYPHTKKSLIHLLKQSYAQASSHTPAELAEWCWLFWSRWRDDEDDLFHRTDELTIDIVMEIGEEWVSREGAHAAHDVHLSKEQLEKWLERLG